MLKTTNSFQFLNSYSIFLVIAYLLYFVLNAIYYFFPVANLFMTFPIIWGIVIWSSWIITLKENANYQLDKRMAFHWDLFSISYGFVIGTLIAFDIRFANADIRGWGPFALYYSCFLGFSYACIYSLFAIQLKSHQKYTFIFFIIICLFEFGINLIAYNNPLSFYRSDKFYYLFIGVLLLIHISICMLVKLLARLKKVA
ncbi:hypothetical protein SC122_03715 [Legionella pneumophila serogroup 1]|nr:hypothetical protein [Legionella pneumophila]HAT7746822.1 hypothetical protein [Legionella pneumophila]HAT7759297.1 hypothetical protein [Legionella pneumophila]HAU2065246.1 hypothetical protein [Legionella pneumophila]